jgi:hypothetical protein
MYERRNISFTSISIMLIGIVVLRPYAKETHVLTSY